MALKEKILDKAQKLIQKGYLDKAVAEYRAAAELDPRDISIRLRIGDLYVKLNKKADAIKEYTEVAKANSQRGFYLKAIAVYKQVLKLDETNLDIHYRLAELYIKQRLIADAISEYSLIVSTFERKGKMNDVMELLKKMSEIDPENVGVRLKLADLYQKLSFEKDALLEYAWIFDKLISLGKAEKAEKIYLGLYNSNPKEVEILKGLSSLYKRKGDDIQFLRFARPLFQILRDWGDTEEAKSASLSILEVRPDEKECLDFMERFKPKEVNFEQYAPKETSEPPSPVQPAAEAREEAPVMEEALISWPEEEIEITLEGFEEELPSDFKTESEFAVEPEKEIQAVEEEKPEKIEPEKTETIAEAEPPQKKGGEEAEIEIELKEEEPPISIPEIGAIEAESPVAQKPPVEEIEIELLKEEEIIPLPQEADIEEIRPEEKTAESLEGEIEIELGEGPKEKPEETAPPEPEIEIEFNEPASAPVEEFKPEAIKEEEFKEEPLISIPEIEELKKEDIEKPVEAAVPEERPATEDEIAAAIREAEESVSVSLKEAEKEKEIEAPLEERPEEKPLLEIELPEEKPEEKLLELEYPEEKPAGEIKEEEFKAEVSIEWAEKPQPVPEITEKAEEIEIEPSKEVAGAVHEEATEHVEPVTEREPEPEAVPEIMPEEMIHAETVFEEPLKGIEHPSLKTAEEAEEDLSEAISELMEKMGQEEMPVIPADKLIEPEKEKIAEPSPEGEEYVDLTAELGMEEALKDLAQPWDKRESKETFDEFKTGIGKQLSKEDTETHYNLGIAYMEMELHNEACKEFKIALKDPRLEFDCYIRLGLCAMAEHNPHEAIMFYLKGLKLEGKSDEERKGMMYELALAYESAKEMDEASQLFNSIYEMDPHFREVAKKVKLKFLPQIPLDDGLIEVELL